MAYTLQQYNPLSHLGQLLYQDSVAERDARLKQETERSRIQAETDAYQTQAQVDALRGQIGLRAMRDPASVAQGTRFADVFGAGLGGMIAPSGAETATSVSAPGEYEQFISTLAKQYGVPVEVVMAAYMGVPGAQEDLKARISRQSAVEQTEQTEQVKQVQQAETALVQGAQRAARTLAEMDRATQLLETTGTGPLSIQGLANLPTDSTAFKLFQAQLRSPEAETLKRLLANRFGDIRQSAFGDRLFASEVPAALDLVPDLLDRPEVIKAAIDTIALGARYDILAASLYQTLQQMYRAGELRDEAGRPRRITMMDIQEVYQEAADLLMADADAAGTIESINAALGT